MAHILRQSAAKLFAAKYKLTTQRQVYLIAGKQLGKPLLSSKRRSKKSVIGQTDEQLRKWAIQAGGKLDHKLPQIPFLTYSKIPHPDVSALSRGWNPPRSLSSENFPDPLRKLEWRGTRGRTSLKGTCAKCGETENVEMHRALKHLKGRDPIEILMIAARRKQIPLCRECHKLAHGWQSHNKLNLGGTQL